MKRILMVIIGMYVMPAMAEYPILPLEECPITIGKNLLNKGWGYKEKRTFHIFDFQAPKKKRARRASSSPVTAYRALTEAVKNDELKLVYFTAVNGRPMKKEWKGVVQLSENKEYFYFKKGRKNGVIRQFCKNGRPAHLQMDLFWMFNGVPKIETHKLFSED